MSKNVVYIKHYIYNNLLRLYARKINISSKIYSPASRMWGNYIVFDITTI